MIHRYASLMQLRCSFGKAAKRGSNGIKFNLFQFRLCFSRRRITVNHVIGAKDTQAQILINSAAAPGYFICTRDKYLYIAFRLHRKMHLPQFGNKFIYIEEPVGQQNQRRKIKTICRELEEEENHGCRPTSHCLKSQIQDYIGTKRTTALRRSIGTYSSIMLPSHPSSRTMAA